MCSPRPLLSIRPLQLLSLAWIVPKELKPTGGSESATGHILACILWPNPTLRCTVHGTVHVLHRSAENIAFMLRVNLVVYFATEAVCMSTLSTGFDFDFDRKMDKL
jgi:hypothetical protein